MAAAPVIIDAADADVAAMLADPARWHDALVEACRPVVIRGLARHWPVVAVAATGGLGDYLARIARPHSIDIFEGPAAIRGAYYYDAAMTGFNFTRRSLPFDRAIAHVTRARAADDPTAYLGSVPLNDYAPAFAADNPAPLAGMPDQPRLWLGHAARIACHYDALDNLACVVAGLRHFTLYPPDAIGDLYVGPIDFTMAGQPVAMAVAEPANRARYPDFARAADRAITVALAPGDALYLPKLWWHQVESTGPAAAMINYWWDATGSGDGPYAAMMLAMIAIAERPVAERGHWRAFFDHYVFRPRGHPLRHLPPASHGLLGPLRPDNYGRIRARVMQLLRGL